jgi:allophanate hydrolase
MRWLQGLDSYVDLRQPAGRPTFGSVAGIHDLSPPQIDWMARPLAFAGRLTRADGVFAWNKTVGLHPVEPDLGRLRFEGETLVEQALDMSYVEHWNRHRTVADPVAELHLNDPAGRRGGVVVRGGLQLGFARSRDVELAAGVSLADLLAGQSTLRARQDLLDCEVALTTLDGDRWRVMRSAMPWREGALLGFAPLGAETILMWERCGHSSESQRHWEVVSAAGDPGTILSPRAFGSA